jgi:hypothetical protein
MCVHVLYVVGQIFSADDGPVNIFSPNLVKGSTTLAFYSRSYLDEGRPGDCGVVEHDVPGVLLAHVLLQPSVERHRAHGYLGF